jgi:predicted amidophosphoribosyltransferase
LLDDVSTTGATLNEAAKVLKKAGTANVYTAVVTKRDPAIAASHE